MGLIFRPIPFTPEVSGLWVHLAYPTMRRFPNGIQIDFGNDRATTINKDSRRPAGDPPVEVSPQK